MSRLLKPLQVRERLLEQGVRIFAAGEFARFFQESPYAIRYFLEEQTKRGLLTRLKPGLYILKTDPPKEEEIANALYKPSYISLEYALAHYGILPEMPYQITSVTTKPTRLFTTTNRAFSYQTIKPEAYTGYYLEKAENHSFLIADREKALVDYLYFETLGKRPHNDRLYLKGLDKEKLFTYAQLYERGSLNETVKETYDRLG